MGSYSIGPFSKEKKIIIYLASLDLSSPMACGMLVPAPGIEPTSPTLGGRFLTTGPPEKSHNIDPFLIGFLYSASCPQGLSML